MNLGVGSWATSYFPWVRFLNIVIAWWIEVYHLTIAWCTSFLHWERWCRPIVRHCTLQTFCWWCHALCVEAHPRGGSSLDIGIRYRLVHLIAFYLHRLVPGAHAHTTRMVAGLECLEAYHSILLVDPVLCSLDPLCLWTINHWSRKILLDVALNWLSQVYCPSLHVLVYHWLPLYV